MPDGALAPAVEATVEGTVKKDGQPLPGAPDWTVVNAGGHTAFQIDPSAVLGSTDTVTLNGLNIVGDGTTGDTYGVLFNGAYHGPSDGAINLTNTSVAVQTLRNCQLPMIT